MLPRTEHDMRTTIPRQMPARAGAPASDPEGLKPLSPAAEDRSEKDRLNDPENLFHLNQNIKPSSRPGY
jgi:hypothetical protein